MGALVTLELPADSPILDLPWVVTFGPLDDEGEWEPVVCGPYERAHALGLAQAVVANDDLMAVVEPVTPAVSPVEIQAEIDSARRGSAGPADGEEYEGGEDLVGVPDLAPPPSEQEVRAGFARLAAALAER